MAIISLLLSSCGTNNKIDKMANTNKTTNYNSNQLVHNDKIKTLDFKEDKLLSSTSLLEKDVNGYAYARLFTSVIEVPNKTIRYPIIHKDFTSVYAKGFVFQNHSEFKCLVSGLYLVQYSFSGSFLLSPPPTSNVVSFIEKNGNVLPDGDGFCGVSLCKNLKSRFSAEVIILLNEDDILRLSIKNNNTTDSIAVQNLNFVITRID